MSVVEDQIIELMNTHKVKFKTHKQRKAFVGALLSLVDTTTQVNNHATNLNRDIQKNSVIKLIPDKKAKGEVIMTKGLSQKGDDIADSHIAKKANANSYA